MGTPIQDDPETFMMFVEESVDALGRVERLCLDAEKGTYAPNLMATLFRDMHTIKGTSGFLALDRIAGLAHAAEDLMGAVRDGTLEPQPTHFSMLLQVVDGLRGMIDHAREVGDEGPVDHGPLVSRLRGAMTATPAPAPAPVEAPEIEAPKAEEPKAEAPKMLGEILVEHGAATKEQVDHAIEVQQSQQGGENTVRVSVQILDRLMNLMGELVLARNQIVQVARGARDTGGSPTHGAVQRLGLITSELQEEVMKTRMQPIGRVFEKIPRVVRDLQAQVGKKVEVVLEGTQTELDRALIEAIRDPITHMVRNAVDHGIETPADRVAAGKPETGRMVVRAAHASGMVVLEIEDDGRGMDPAKLRAHAIKRGVITAAEAARMTDRDALELVFRPGFSTAEKVSAISGRGVGMDVVRTSIARAGGQVELQSVVGKGTQIRVKMPLTLAIISTLLVRAGDQRFCIPQVSLIELVYLDEEQAKDAIVHVRDAEIYMLRGELLPIVRLADVLGLPRAEHGDASIVVVAAGKQRYGLYVDEILDTEEIVVKPMHPRLKRLGCYAGSTVLGDGSVGLILEPDGIAAMAGLAVAGDGRGDGRTHTIADIDAPERLLVVRAGDGAPCAVPLDLVARLERIPQRSIERVGGREVVQYRNTIMPLVRPEEAAPLGAAPPRAADAQQHVIVFDFGRPVGMLVGSIVDIVETGRADIDRNDDTPGAAGTAVIFGQTTLVLDVDDILRRLAPKHARAQAGGV